MSQWICHVNKKRATIAQISPKLCKAGVCKHTWWKHTNLKTEMYEKHISYDFQAFTEDDSNIGTIRTQPPYAILPIVLKRLAIHVVNGQVMCGILFWHTKGSRIIWFVVGSAVPWDIRKVLQCDFVSWNITSRSFWQRFQGDWLETFVRY